MKDEIKEILDRWNKVCNNELEYVELTLEQMRLLFNYITNLQEENERLEEIVENLTTMTVCGDRKQIKNTAQYKLDIYKSRNEKAIEYIDKYVSYYDMEGDLRNRLLNILKGSDE